MRRLTMLAAVAGLAGAGVACEAGEMEDTPEAAETFGGEAAPATEEDAPAASAGTMVSLAVDSLDGAAYLTDGQGRALYLLEGEPADSSTCYDECAREWPPLMTGSQGTPRAGAAPLREDLVGTIQRRDGQRQVTYAGHPLYYYHDDRNPGETSGQDLTDQWGEWYLVTPSGEPLEEEGG